MRPAVYAAILGAGVGVGILVYVLTRRSSGGPKGRPTLGRSATSMLARRPSQPSAGGEARQFLFYESTKTRKLLSSPEPTISWRGVKEEPPPSLATSLAASTASSPFAPLDREAARRVSEARARGIPPGVLATKAARSKRPESARQPRAPPFGVGY